MVQYKLLINRIIWRVNDRQNCETNPTCHPLRNSLRMLLLLSRERKPPNRAFGQQAPSKYTPSLALQSYCMVTLGQRVAMFCEKFEHDGLKYKLEIDCAGNVALNLAGGASRKGYYRKWDLYDLFPDSPIYDDVNLVRNGLTVLRKASKILQSFVYRERPWKISFRAATKRKGRIFQWMSKRLAKRLTGYCLVEFPAENFNFYRLAREAA